MNILLIYSIYIYINVGVEANPRIFLNGIYTNTNKLHKHYVNPSNHVEGIKFIQVTKQDTIDINECTKEENEEECLRRLKETPSKYIRRLSRQPFILDKTYVHDQSEDKQNSIYGYNTFSQDYLDINDLFLRSGTDGGLEQPLNKKKPRKSQIIKVLRPNKFDRFTFDLTKSRRNNNKKNKYESEESDSSTSSESWEPMQINKIAKNKRFQIVDNIQDSESESSEEVRIEKKKPNIRNKNRLLYMQSPSRVYDGRRRLPHFLPKRYIWNKQDVKELRNYWVGGPQGKYWLNE